jgi:hypothetical protein
MYILWVLCGGDKIFGRASAVWSNLCVLECVQIVHNAMVSLQLFACMEVMYGMYVCVCVFIHTYICIYIYIRARTQQCVCEVVQFDSLHHLLIVFV